MYSSVDVCARIEAQIHIHMICIIIVIIDIIILSVVVKICTYCMYRYVHLYMYLYLCVFTCTYPETCQKHETKTGPLIFMSLPATNHLPAPAVSFLRLNDGQGASDQQRGPGIRWTQRQLRQNIVPLLQESFLGPCFTAVTTTPRAD